MALTNAQKTFINEIAPMAIKSWNDTHIVIPSVTIAQAILESGWGSTALATHANNLFGIKADNSWKGDKYYINTTEYRNGSYVTVKAAFRKYKSRQQSIDDHTSFLNTKRYKACHGVTDAKQAITAIHQGGYATAPDYVSKIMKVINNYNLTQYDNQSSGQTTPVEEKSMLYTVQVGAFSKKENAEKMCSNMKNRGYSGSFIVFNPTDRLFRVQVGSFSIKLNAEKMKKKLKEEGINSIIKEKIA